MAIGREDSDGSVIARSHRLAVANTPVVLLLMHAMLLATIMELAHTQNLHECNFSISGIAKPWSVLLPTGVPDQACPRTEGRAQLTSNAGAGGSVTVVTKRKKHALDRDYPSTSRYGQHIPSRNAQLNRNSNVCPTHNTILKDFETGLYQNEVCALMS